MNSFLPNEAEPRGNGIVCAVCGVRPVTFCDALASAHLHRLAELHSLLVVPGPRLLFSEATPAEHVFNLLEGTVRLSKMLPDGRRQITGFLFAGDMLGLARDEMYPYLAETIEPVKLCRFPRRQFLDLLKEMPELEHRLLEMAWSELVATQDQILLLGRKHAHERVISFLLLLSRRAQKRGEPASPVHLPMNRSDIADYLGLTIETVSRILTRLGRDGLIELVTSRRVALLQPDRLARVDSGEDAL